MNILLPPKNPTFAPPSDVLPNQNPSQNLYEQKEFLELQTFKTEERILNEQHHQKPMSSNNIVVLPTIKKAIQKFKKNLINSNQSLLDEPKIKMINDAAYIVEPIEENPFIKNDKLKNFLIKLSKLIKKINKLPIFTPYDKTRLLWDLIQFIILLFLFYWMPVELGFNAYLPKQWYDFFFAMFIIDIFVNMNTAYIVNGFMVQERSLIYNTYIKNCLVWDILTCIAFIIERPYDNSRHDIPNTSYLVFQFLFFLRYDNLKKIYERFLERIYSKFNIRDGYTDLINLIFVCFFIIQVFASIWHFIAEINTSDSTWMTSKGISEANLRVRYIHSLYWSTVTIMTVGYGDISPQNMNEIIFVTFAVVVGCGTVAFIISSITEVGNQFRNETRVYKQNLYVMNKFMNRKNINSNLQMKVRQYLKFIWQEESTQNAEMEENIINKLSKTLKDEIYNEANGYLLYKHSMFFANFSENILRSLMYYMKEVRYNPGDVIFSESTLDDCEIFFLMKGNVEISSKSTNRYIRDIKLNNKVLTQDAVFGEMGFFAGQKRSVSARSKDFTSLICIKRDDFLNVLRQFPQDYDRYCKIKDQLLNENYNMAINLSCMACKQYDHLVINCPYIHYDKMRFLIKIGSQLNGQKTRRKFRRKKLKDLNSRAHIKVIQNMSVDFQDDEKFDSPSLIIQKPILFKESTIEDVKEDTQHHINLIPQKNNENKKFKFYFEPHNNRESLYEPQVSPSPLNYQENIRINEDKDINKFIETFEKYHLFHYYKPEFNHKKFKTTEKVKKPLNQKDLIIKNKLLRFFMEKKQKTQNFNEKNEFFSNTKNFFLNCFRRKKNDCFAENLLTSDEIQLMNFFDLVLEVMSNNNLRKKLSSIKDGVMRTKKNKNKNKLI